MSILVNKRSRIVVQGVGDDIGRLHTAASRIYGHGRHCFVAGVAPALAGRTLDGIPIFDNVADARAATGATASVVYAPADQAVDAIEEAARAGMELVVCVSNGVAAQGLARLRELRRGGPRLLGPGCAGLLTPGEVTIGTLRGEAHRRGPIGIVTRSVDLASQLARQLMRFGLGASTVVALAQDRQTGLTHLELLKLFDADPATDAVVLIGPIDDEEEQACADWIAQRMVKPVVGFIDEASPAQPQRARLQGSGAHMTRNPAMLGELTASVVDSRWLPFD
jgi:succinyl-CoA synthetase alpha subunit